MPPTFLFPFFALLCIDTAFLFSADLADLNLPKTCQIDFPDPDDLLNFQLIITPDEVSAHPNTYISIPLYSYFE